VRGNLLADVQERELRQVPDKKRRCRAQTKMLSNRLKERKTASKFAKGGAHIGKERSPPGKYGFASLRGEMPDIGREDLPRKRVSWSSGGLSIGGNSGEGGSKKMGRSQNLARCREHRKKKLWHPKKGGA